MLPIHPNPPPNRSVKNRRMTKLLAEAQQMAQLGAWELEAETYRLNGSAEFCRLLSLPSSGEALSFEHFLGLVHPEDTAPFREAVNQTLREGKAFQLEMRLVAPGNPPKYVLSKGQPQRRKGRNGLVGILLDLDDRKRLELEWRQAKEEAESLNRSKSDFLSTISHEIRTPINAIVGLTDVLLNEDLKPSVTETIQLIKFSSDNLLVLLNDILNLSKIEAGMVTFERVEFDLRQRMDAFGKTIGLTTQGKGVQFRYDIHEEIPNVLIGDPYRLNQILLNLASNAVKFTRMGYIHLRIALLGRDGDQVRLSFSVEDTGIGILEEKLTQIFERFAQASSTTTRQYGGTGLGLAITKKLVELQHGKIGATSTVGQGSTFTVELPFQVSPKTALAPPGTPRTTEKDLSGVRLLMVEDNVLNQLVAKRLLNRWKADLDIAGDGQEALDLLQKHHYDLVLMDLHLPGMSGLEIAGMIRGGNAGVMDSRIPIVALTADAFPGTGEKTRAAGMNDWVVKPFDQDAFFGTIVRNLPPRPHPKPPGMPEKN
ncbi:MAG: response regulator [Ferruginibacter sp.]|nr:response regulator [Cytophagales bacterium]